MRKFLFLFLILFFTIGADYTEFMQDFYFLGQNKQGVRLYEAWAQKAYMFKDIIKMEVFTAKVYGDTPATIKADKASLLKETNDIKLQENVQVQTDARTLQTEELDWQPKKNVAFTDSDVLIIQKDLSINAKGLQQNMAEEKLSLKEDVVIAFKKDDSSFTYINCDGPMEIDYKENIAVLYGNVKVSDPQGEIYADKMVMFFEPEEKTVRKVYATGHVKIIREDSTTFAEEAEYNFKTEKLTLKGNPRVLIVSDERL